MTELEKLKRLPQRLLGRKLLALLAEPEADEGVIAFARQLLRDTLSPEEQTLGPIALRHRLARNFHIDLADWDFQAPRDRVGPVVSFPIAAWLEDLRSPFNVGSIVRTAEAYGFEACWTSLDSPGADHPRARRSAMGADEHLSLATLSLEEVRRRCGKLPVFALELGGTPVDEFDFPAEGLVLVGGEELGLSAGALAWADGSAGRVSLPLYGRKASLNVGVAFGVLAAAWTRSLLCPHRNEQKKAAPKGGTV